MLKVYAHYEGQPSFTKILKPDASDTVQSLAAAFVSAYNQRHPDAPQLDPCSAVALGPDRKALPATASAGKVLVSGADVEIVCSKATTSAHASDASSPVCATHASASSSPSAQQQQQRPAATVTEPASAGPAVTHGAHRPMQEQQSGRASSSAAATAAPLALQHALLLGTLSKRAQEAAAVQNYRLASDLLQQALQVAPGHVETLRALVQLWLEAKNAPAGTRWALQAAEQHPDDASLQELAGVCLSEAGRPRDALPYLQQALALVSAAGRAKPAATTTAGSGSPSPSDDETRLRLALAAALHAVPDAPEYQELAAGAVMAVLEQDETNWEALRLYATIALSRGLRGDALRVVLRLVVLRPQHDGVKAMLAACLKDQEGVEILLEELSQAQEGAEGGDGAAGQAAGGGSAAALAFLATSIRDHGAVDGTVALLARASAMSPGNASYALNHVHALELRQALAAAVAAGRGYCAACGTKLMGLRLKAVDELLAPLPHLASVVEPTWLLSAPWDPPPSLAARCADAEAGGLPLPLPVDKLPSAPGTTKVQYSSSELDVLALLFTMAKVLYVGGALHYANALCDLVEPLRRASAVELHTTLIRNEAAYFGCVLQLLKDHPPPQQPPPAPAAAPLPSAQPLYLIGDSHCLSGAWRYVELRGQRRLLHPLLVTGCKIWHLRPASSFYPKVQFLNTMALLPDGAQLVMCFGEIDCREGLLLAVQKGKYDTLEEGMEATVSIYISVLDRLVRERGFEVFVHPVAPVLNETRHITKPFTAVLRRRVLAAARSAQLAGRLHYLDFFNDLLTGPQGAEVLKPELALDGTHLAPSYVQYVQAAMQRVAG